MEPDFPMSARPLLRRTMPLTPSGPDSAELNTRLPLDEWPLPDIIDTRPPETEYDHPADTTTSPPKPLEPDPTVTYIDPPRPLIELPVPR